MAKDYSQMSVYNFCNEILNDTDLKITIADNMKKYGGSFVKALAECVYTADQSNLFTLVENFTNYFHKYLPEKWPNK